MRTFVNSDMTFKENLSVKNTLSRMCEEGIQMRSDDEETIPITF